MYDGGRRGIDAVGFLLVSAFELIFSCHDVVESCLLHHLARLGVGLRSLDYYVILGEGCIYAVELSARTDVSCLISILFLWLRSDVESVVLDVALDEVLDGE